MSRLRTLLTSFGVLALLLLAGLTPAPAAHAAGTGDDYPAALRTAAKDSLVDPWRFYNRECVSFVAWRLNQQGGTTSAPWSFSNFMTGPNGTSVQFGNAYQWLDAARKGGWTYDRTPRVGAVAYWDVGQASATSLGHVAVVTEVNADGTVDIEEYNWSTRGGYGQRSNVRAPYYLHIRDEDPVTRVTASTRYALSARTSATAFPAGVPVAYVATSARYADGLTAAPAAARGSGPLLLVGRTTFPSSVAAELARLRPARIVVIGGPAVVSDDVVAALAGCTTGTVSRVTGATRYELSARTSAAAYPAGVPVAYVATGGRYPDGLSAGPAAAVGGGPLLLTPRGSLPAATAAELKRLRPGRIVVVGGPTIVSDDVVAALRGLTSGSVTRVLGASRYVLSARLSATAFPAGVPVAYVATGSRYADGLSGSAAASAKGGPQLLVPADSLPAATVAELTRLRPARIVVLGGPSAVSAAVLDALGAYVR
ncbi:cell wall-binding repeat-containing protein [Phycicoccus flavus]|uniref:CHAP domain-containing protein n=1 Tax=Phycicoccus flavus TaxID=2502783 RepID=A0A8T6R1G2_9MICO|nr:cell wall-binding repeat-containing protein [Phycicoccus flavus]NHA67340.1 CHAP domain-containing protein [Phycicoccus flavus]